MKVFHHLIPLAGAEAGRPLLHDAAVQAGIQLRLYQQEGLSDRRGEGLNYLRC